MFLKGNFQYFKGAETAVVGMDLAEDCKYC